MNDHSTAGLQIRPVVGIGDRSEMAVDIRDELVEQYRLERIDLERGELDGVGYLILRWPATRRRVGLQARRRVSLSTSAGALMRRGNQLPMPLETISWEPSGLR